MRNLFIIIQLSPDWYMLLLRDSLYCISCGGDLEKIYSIIRKYVKKYKTKEKLLKVVSQFEDEGKVPILIFEDRKKFVSSSAHLFEEEINNIVSETLKEVRDSEVSPFQKARKLLPQRKQTAESAKTVNNSGCEEKQSFKPEKTTQEQEEKTFPTIHKPKIFSFRPSLAKK